ncbi:MAG TPA: AI-2E family transporter [Alphaproteobacteria bacterium]|nr:AI-2E family transporter [Alphaproteobacteria bacterium]
MTTTHQILFWGLAVLVAAGLISLFQPVLFPFVLGGAIAYLLNPIVNKLSKGKVKRPWVVLGILGAFFLVVGLILAVITPILIKEAADFIHHAPELAQNIWDKIEPRIVAVQEQMGYHITADQLQTAVKDNIGKALQVSKGVLGGLTKGGIAIVDFISTLLITPVAAYFLMKEWPAVMKFVNDLLPRQHAPTIKRLAGDIDRKISGFVRGQITVCVLLGLIYALALSIAGLNYGFFIGLGTGILSIIPFVGSTVGLVTSLAVAFFQSGGDWTFIGMIAVIFFIGQFIEGNFITPKLMGDSVGLHPLWIIFALMAGGSLMGLLGMFLSVPVAASIGVLVGFLIETYKKSPYYHHQLEADKNGA